MNQRRHILLIAYYWPPSGGVSVQRWLKLSKYLVQNDVELSVLTVDPEIGSYPSVDDNLVHQVDKRIRVYTTNSFEPIQIFKSLFGKKNLPGTGFVNYDDSNRKMKWNNRIRSNLFVPDPRVGWVPYAVPKALEIIKENKIDTVITTSPPHSVQIIGYKIKKKLGNNIHWIADFRDPWTDIYYYDVLQHSAWSAQRDKKWEKKVINSADGIMTVSPGVKDQLLEKSSDPETKKIKVLTNGFDGEDYDSLSNENDRNDDDFVITYTGKISDKFGIRGFLQAVKEVQDSHPDRKVVMRFVGVISDALVDYSREIGLENVDLVGQVPHSQIKDYQRSSDLLMLSSPQVDNNKGIMNLKLFEYLGAQRPILAIAYADSDIGDILKKTDSGRLFDYADIEGMSSYISNLMDAPPDWKFENSAYEKSNQAKELLSFLDEEFPLNKNEA